MEDRKIGGPRVSRFYKTHKRSKKSQVLEPSVWPHFFQQRPLCPASFSCRSTSAAAWDVRRRGGGGSGGRAGRRLRPGQMAGFAMEKHMWFCHSMMEKKSSCFYAWNDMKCYHLAYGIKKSEIEYWAFVDLERWMLMTFIPCPPYPT